MVRRCDGATVRPRVQGGDVRGSVRRCMRTIALLAPSDAPPHRRTIAPPHYNPAVAPRFFSTAFAFDRWLASNHAKARALLVGFYKVGSGKRRIRYREALD